jgi:hypothetical protein
MIRDGGCAWVRRKGDRYKGVPTEHCNKLVVAGSEFCPKHLVMTEGKQDEDNRKMARLRDRKAYKKQLTESLKDSPLAAVNPVLDKHKHGYSV